MSRMLRTAGYSGLFVLVLVIGIRITFPKRILAYAAEAQLERALGFKNNVTVGSAGLRGIAGVRLRDVTIQPHARPGGSRPLPMTIEDTRASAGLLSLIRRRPRVKLDTHVAGGRIVARLRPEKGDARSIDVEIHDIDLRQVTLLAGRLGMPYRGTVRGTINLGFNDEGALSTGNLDMNLLNAAFGPGEIPNSRLPAAAQRFYTGNVPFDELNLGQLHIRGPIEGGILTTDTLRVGGGDVQIDGSGSIAFRPRITESQLSLTMSLGINPEWIAESEIGGMIGQVPELRLATAGGHLTFSLTGPLNRPQFRPGSANAVRPGRGRSGAARRPRR